MLYMAHFGNNKWIRIYVEQGDQRWQTHTRYGELVMS